MTSIWGGLSKLISMVDRDTKILTSKNKKSKLLAVPFLDKPFENCKLVNIGHGINPNIKPQLA